MAAERTKKRLAKFARAATWFSLAATALGFAGQLFWLFDLFAEFRLQFALLGLILAAAWTIKRRWPLAATATATLALNLLVIIPLFHRPGANAQGTKLRIVQANLFYKNPRVDLIQAFLERENADIVCLYEFSGDQKALIPWLESRYPHHADAPLIGDARSALYSRFPLKNPEALVSKFTLRQGVRTTALIQNREVDFFVLHPTIPLYPGAADGRNGQLEEVATLAESCPRPALMIGDFNITPFSAHYPPKKHHRLRDLGQGFGPLPTFPMFMPLLLVPIDHLFATPEFTAPRRSLGPFIGSDHLPITTDLVLAP